MLILLGAIAGLFTGCAIPGKMRPQSDITPIRVGSMTSEQIVLLASHSSEFKKILVENISRAVTAENKAVDIAGIESLLALKSEEYAAIVIISACLDWSVDPLVRKFIDRSPDHDRILLVITSDSDWLPKKTDLDVDAMTSASVLADSDAVSRQIITRLQEKLGHI